MANPWQQRTAVHHFLPDVRIPLTDFQSILADVRLTPSGYNAQPWHFILIQDPTQLQTVQDIAFGQSHLTAAGSAVVVCGHRDFGPTEHDRILSEWATHRHYSPQQLDQLSRSLLRDRPPQQRTTMALRSCSLAAMSFLLSATTHGWATCPMMGFDQRRLSQHLALPEGWFPVLLIALGKADPTQAQLPMPRKPVSQLYSLGKFSALPTETDL